ncbi:TPA: diphosphomevalonate decarboxylase [Candidatus Peribacteria bacterium]|nr:MAG: diphosphomevalonate decarboxylase [Candidatus Peribacteria bacterium RIFOXYC2_FULL_58_10]HAI98392.1 diphosphomevalonate decarboxylase [Candidatus Peribacteria bacterium]HAS33813.1 diphosphomevalonate decarboxylase [Candidatus Peribacteria bacterium]
MVTARSTPNIALIKYWGNRNNELRLPAADSLSLSLSSPSVEIDVDFADALNLRSFEANGSPKELTDAHINRFRKHLELTKNFLKTLGAERAIPASVSVTIRSAIPPAVGLASSAAVFSCLARAYAALIEPVIALTDTQMSVIGRLGSGSAARSIFGGYAALCAGTGNGIASAIAEQIAPEDHWTLHDIVIIPSKEEKKIGSTEGHALAPTSPFFAARVEAIGTRRQQECISAILARDFEKLQKVTEEDALDMHHVMETSTPPLHYLTEDTHRIIKAIEELRASEHIPVLYTMDAGPTVHLLCPSESLQRIRSFAQTQKGCTVFETHAGPGASLIG